MLSMRFLVAAITVSWFVACTSSDKSSDPLLQEAARYHQQATDIQKTVEPQIEQIDSLKAMTPDNPTRIATLDSLKTAFDEWETNIVEVPGMPHEHHHHKKGEAHHHADATLKDLPADQMRDLQRETLNNIRQIQTRLNEVAKTN